MAPGMMRWRPWPAVVLKKFQVRLVVKRMVGAEGAARAMVVVRWKGIPRLLRRKVVRNYTREEETRQGGVVVWKEAFERVCAVSAYAGGNDPFHLWEIEFQVFNGMSQGQKAKTSLIGTASLNLTEFMSMGKGEIELNLPLVPAEVTTKSHPSLHLTLSLLELRTLQNEPAEITLQTLPAPLSHLSYSPSLEKDAPSVIKSGLKKVRVFTSFISARKAKKAFQNDGGSEGRFSAKSDDTETTYSFDSDSLDDDPNEREIDYNDHTTITRSISYGTLTSANCVDGSLYSDMSIKGDYEDWVYYTHQRSDAGSSHTEKMSLSISGHYTICNSKKSILPWKKRKLIPRSPKAKGGEPLLKKAYKEEGGDDIDYDRRQLSSSDDSVSKRRNKVGNDGVPNRLSVSDFGDDNFEIGNWETKEIVSRDGHMKLSAEVFLASMDQRSDSANGEGACSALVVVIADWFHKNQGKMPIKSQLDCLIREGSHEWRNLCENRKYHECFHDNHFDLETIMEANICPLSIESGKSFIGFFLPEVTNDKSGLDFLHGAMSFDDIWNEISQTGSRCNADGSPLLYIISWNDHFFVLKVEQNAYYIIDTLGERLHEGCKQGYILKFDKSTSIHEIKHAQQKFDKSTSIHKIKHAQQNTNASDEENLVCRGKETCKEYIKSFLAAIPIREVQTDIKKGQINPMLLYQRLQIEFHCTHPSSASSIQR